MFLTNIRKIICTLILSTVLVAGIAFHTRKLISKRGMKTILIALLTFSYFSGIMQFSPVIPNAHASGTPVSSCQTISTAGNYFLSADISFPILSPGCIVITANNVVLDCMGHMLTGPGSSGLDNGNAVTISSNSSIVENCRMAHSGRGVAAWSFDQVLNNTIWDMQEGINLGGSSRNDTVANNYVFDNSGAGYGLGRAFTIWCGPTTCGDNNTIIGNKFTNSQWGIDLGLPFGSGPPTHSNLFYNNYVANNTVNVRDQVGGLNFWNITERPGRNILGGSFLGGNFWSDYRGRDLDGDGLGDTLLPYTSGGNIGKGGDFLPLFAFANPTAPSVGGFNGPVDIAYDPSNNCLYVSNSNTGTVSVLNSTNNVAATISVPSLGGYTPAPWGIVYDPSNSLIYVANDVVSGSVSAINGTSNTVVTTIPIGVDPVYPAYDPANRNIYVTQESSLAVINSTTNSVVATISLGGINPTGIAYDPLTRDLYVTNHLLHNVWVVDPRTNTVIATITVGLSPFYAAFDPANGKMYVTNSGSNTTSVIDTRTNTVVATIPVGGGPAALAFYPADNNMYVTNSGSNTTSVIDSRTNIVIQTLSMGTNPVGVGFYPANDAMYVTNFGSTTVSIISASPTILASTLSGFSAPYGQSYDPANNFLYVANWNTGTVSVLNATNTIVATINVGPASSGVGPVGVAYDPSNNFVYVVNHAPSSSVSVINGTSNTVVATIPVGGYSYYATFDPANNNIYVSNFSSNTISVINSTNSVVATIPLPSSSGPTGIAYDPLNHDLYVTSHFSGNAVFVIDPTSNAIITTISVGVDPYYAAYDPANGKMYVTNNQSNSTSVIDTLTNTVVATIPVGGFPSEVEFYPTDNNMYVANSASTSTTISIIGSKTNAVVQTIVVGTSPVGVGFYPANDAMYVTNFGSTTVSILTLFDFSISNSGDLTIVPGNSASNSITVTLKRQPAQFVTLSVSGLPSGASASFSGSCSGTPSCTDPPTFSTTLTISTLSSTPAGAYTITVAGTGGGLIHTTQFTLTLPAFDFSLSNSGGITILQGSSGFNTITVSLASGTAQPVSLSCSGLPSGAACSFNPTSGTPNFSSTLTVSSLSSTPAGSFTITVTATGGGATHTTQFTLTVNPSGTIGGVTVPIDKLATLALIIGLASLLVTATAVTAIYLNRVKRPKEV